MNGNTAVMAAQVPGPVQGPDLDLAHDLAAGGTTTSTKVLSRYRNTWVCLLLSWINFLKVPP